jgi:hypothetical protein
MRRFCSARSRTPAAGRGSPSAPASPRSGNAFATHRVGDGQDIRTEQVLGHPGVSTIRAREDRPRRTPGPESKGPDDERRGWFAVGIGRKTSQESG